MYLSPGDETAIRLLEHSTVVMLRASPIKNISPDGSAQHVDMEERGETIEKAAYRRCRRRAAALFCQLATALTLPHLQLCRAEH